MSSIIDFISNLQAANTAYENAIADFDQHPEAWQMFTQKLSWSASRMSFGYVDDLSIFRELRDGESRTYDRQRAYQATYTNTIVYKAWQQSATDIKGDITGRLIASASAAAKSALRMWNVKIWERMLANAVTGPDGVVLFSASHPHGYAGATQSNITSSALSHTSYRAGQTAMGSHRKENGDYMAIQGTHLFVPVASQHIAKEVMGTDRVVPFDATGAEASSSVVGGTTIQNVTAGEGTVVIVPEMSAGWVLADLSKSAKPWVAAVDSPLVSTPSTDDESVKQRNEYQWYTQGNIVHGPGHWQLVYRGTT